jgi:FtsH-binding integral membrane protein
LEIFSNFRSPHAVFLVSNVAQTREPYTCQYLSCVSSSHGHEVVLVNTGKGASMLGTILIVLLILALLGVLPRWNHSSNWGYYPTGGVGLVLLVVVVLLLLGRI